LAAVVNPASDSVPLLHPNPAPAPTLPIVLDTGASFSRTPFASDFLPVTPAPYGLIRSASDTSVASKAASTPVDLYTVITGEGAIVDLSSTDTDSVFELATAFGVLESQEFGTANLVFILDPHSGLQTILVEPTQVDWIHWVPLPRLILPESYFHIFGLDYLQAFTLFHLIPIWIYCLLHFAVILED